MVQESHPFIDLIVSDDPHVRNQALQSHCEDLNKEELMAACDRLETFWRKEENLYHRVRALFFLAHIYRFELPSILPKGEVGTIPYAGVAHLLNRRFEEAIDTFILESQRRGIGDALASALADAYHRLAFQTLANQVRKSVRSVRGNQWMFRIGHPVDQPLSVRSELRRAGESGLFPVLRDRTPVRMDLTHSAWSDIFFLGMDYPEGARVINVSIDLAMKGRDDQPAPPVQACFRVIDEPCLRLASLDLGIYADIESLAEVFDFARDYLGLLKAALIAAGLIPPGMEGSGQNLSDLLAKLVGPGKGIELVSLVNGIPKGSRLAVSTNLLASLIAVCMRATGQTESLVGELSESERRMVASRAILGEWLGGSGGGWQDSGGVWPGIKLIEGVRANEADPEFGISYGRLLPQHTILEEDSVPLSARRSLQDSLILVHGGMAQNVGPILEMVTEKYLVRGEKEWKARTAANRLLEELLAALKDSDIRRLGEITTRNFRGPLQDIIPWASNHYTEKLIAAMNEQFGNQFWGFWMLGGMSGGGMGFMVDPMIREEAQTFLLETMLRCKRELENALPFAMDPVVYDFAINPHGSTADLLQEQAALMPVPYYAAGLHEWVRIDPRQLCASRRAELGVISDLSRTDERFRSLVPGLFDQLLPGDSDSAGDELSLEQLLDNIGYDSEQQEDVRVRLQSGQLGLSQNRLPATTTVEDVEPGDVFDGCGCSEEHCARGEEALRQGRVGVVTLAAGTGSRWTQGAGVVKGINPFCRLGGVHRSFVEVHLAKSQRIARTFGSTVPHVFTTSYLTDGPIRATLARTNNYGSTNPVYVSKGQSVGIRMIPMVRDLRFAWEEVTQQLLDEQQEKMQKSLQGALIRWAELSGEGTDYRDNLPAQCLHPVGHWFEIPNLMLNGTLAALLEENPRLTTLMLHNIDTVGADIDAGLLGAHMDHGNTLDFEVIPRRIQDAGGGLARVNGRVQMMEGLALPDERLDFDLSFYNSMTTWIDLDGLLNVFGLVRSELVDRNRVATAVRKLAKRLPTYITLKDVKRRWGHGQEDVFPVSQYEKLWSDMTLLHELDCGFIKVDRLRGQQLKDPAQLDGWVQDGSAAYVESLCSFGSGE